MHSSLLEIYLCLKDSWNLQDLSLIYHAFKQHIGWVVIDAVVEFFGVMQLFVEHGACLEE